MRELLPTHGEKGAQIVEHHLQELELRADRDDDGDLHWQPGYESSPILAVAGISLRGGVAEKDDIVSAAQCLGWRLVETCEEGPDACALQLCRPVIDLRA